MRGYFTQKRDHYRAINLFLKFNLPDAGSDFKVSFHMPVFPWQILRIESAPTYSFMLYHSDYEIPWTHEKLIDPTALVTISLAKFLVRNYKKFSRKFNNPI